MIEYFASLDLVDEGALITGWKIKQGDYGQCKIKVKITQDSELVFDNTKTPQIVFKRPDGKVVLGYMTANNDSTYSYTIVGSELQFAGKVICDVKYEYTAAKESTLSFVFDCVPNTWSPDAKPSDIYQSLVTVGDIESAIESMEQIETQALTKVGLATKDAVDEIEEVGQAYAAQAREYAESSQHWSEQASDWAMQAFSGTPEGYAALVSNVSTIKSDLSNYVSDGYLPTKNLCNGAEVKNNSVSGDDGTKVASTNRLCSQDIAIGDSKTVTVSSVGCVCKAIHKYKSDGTYASYVLGNGTETFTTTLPSDCSMIRVLWGKTDNTDISYSESLKLQVEYGSSKTSYVPYAPSNFEITSIKKSLSAQADDGYVGKNIIGTLEQGSYNGSEKLTNNARVRTDYIATTYGTVHTIHIPSDTEYLVHFYNSSKVYTNSYLNWQSSETFTVTDANAKYITVVFRCKSNTSKVVTPSDYADVRLYDTMSNTQIKTALSPSNVAINISSTNVNGIASSSITQMGKLVTMSLNMGLNDMSTTRQTILTSVPKPYQSVIYATLTSNTVAGRTARVRINKSSGVMDNEGAIVADWYTGNITYIAE